MTATDTPVNNGTARKRVVPCPGVTGCQFRVYASNSAGDGPVSDVANGVRMALRTRGDAATLAPLVRSAVASLDPDLAIYEQR